MDRGDYLHRLHENLRLKNICILFAGSADLVVGFLHHLRMALTPRTMHATCDAPCLQKVPNASLLSSVGTLKMYVRIRRLGVSEKP